MCHVMDVLAPQAPTPLWVNSRLELRLIFSNPWRRGTCVKRSVTGQKRAFPPRTPPGGEPAGVRTEVMDCTRQSNSLVGTSVASFAAGALVVYLLSSRRRRCVRVVVYSSHRRFGSTPGAAAGSRYRELPL